MNSNLNPNSTNKSLLSTSLDSLISHNNIYTLTISKNDKY